MVLPTCCPHPQCGGNNRELLDEKSKSPLFPGTGGWGGGGQRLQMTSILLSLFQKIRNMNCV